MGHSEGVLKGKFIAIQDYLKKTETFQINNLTLHLQELEEQQTKSRVNRRKEITKIRAELNNIETFIPKKQNTHSFQMHMEHFSKTDHMIGQKRSLNKFKTIENISSIFSDHEELKVETDLKEKNPKHSKTCRLNSMLLNNEWVKNEIREEIKKFLETNENELTTTQNLWDTAKEILTGKFIEIQAYLKKIETSRGEPRWRRR